MTAAEQVVTLDKNYEAFVVQQFEILDPRQGIVHVGPEQGDYASMTVHAVISYLDSRCFAGVLAPGVGMPMATRCWSKQGEELCRYRRRPSGALPPRIWC